jgi:HEAT repeat protein
VPVVEPILPFLILILCVAIWILLDLGLQIGTDKLIDGIKSAVGWVRDRTGMADAGQTAYVRVIARRLGSRKQTERLTGAQWLGSYNDRSAVPALLKAIERYNDEPTLLHVVRSLARLEDSRALPALRDLTRHPNPAVAEAAQTAVAALEPKAALLRPSSGPTPDDESLLRPTYSAGDTPQEHLLRPS